MFLAVIGAAMFCSDPTVRAAALIFGISGGAAMRIFAEPKKDAVFYLALFAAVTLTNPLFVHRGATALFYVNGRAFTLEALLYGADQAAAMICALIWFRIFSAVMTSEKIGALFGGSSSLAATLTLVLRYVPTFKKRYREISSAQKTAGFLCGETFLGRVRSRLNVFFSLAESSLELSVRTADSMRARGYMLPRRAEPAKKQAEPADILAVLMSVTAAAALIISAVSEKSYCGFYPRFRFKTDPVSDCLYAAVCALPTFFEIKERIKWRCCNAKT